MASDEDQGEVGAAIRQRIKELRQAAGLSQGELARRVNVEQATIGKYETIRTPSAAMLHAIARALDTTMANLLVHVPGEPSGGVSPEAKQHVRDAVDRWLGENE